MNVLQLSTGDSFSRSMVHEILNSSHDKRIRQKTLDFYRTATSPFLMRNGVVIWLVGIDDSNNKVGLSACAFGCKTRQVIHSITIVAEPFRRMGHGRKLLSTKMSLLRTLYPDASYRSFVNINNQASIRMCSGIGLMITDEGERERRGKKPTQFYVFEDL